MTNEEMIKDLSQIMDLLDMHIDLNQSLNITQMEVAYLSLKCIVRALEQQPCEGMRDATEEERKSTKDYIDSISKPTGLQFDDIYEELDFVQPHKKLSAKLRICGDCISRQAVINAIANTCFWLSADSWEELIKCINSISPVTPAEEQQSCEDAISRAALLEELGEEPINWNDLPEEYQEVQDYQWFKSLVENAPSVISQTESDDMEVIRVSKGALKSRQGRFVVYDVEWLKKNFYITEEKLYGQPKQPCEDCISREEALKAMCDKCPMYNCVTGCSSYRHIEKMPSVTPQPKRGKWIKTYEPNDAEPCILWMCSKCQNAERGRRSKYCPNCGSYNGGEEE